MHTPHRSIAPLLVVALVLAMVMPSVALGSVSVTQKALTTDPYQQGYWPIVSGGRVAFNSVMRPDPTDVYRRVDVWDVASDTSLWSKAYAEVEISDFVGDWVAYRIGMMGESSYVYNVATKQQWTISDTIEGMYVHSIRISGNKAAWLDGDAPSSILKTMDLTTGEVTTEGLLPSVDIAFEGSKIVYSRAFMADTNLFVYDLDTKQTQGFVAQDGPQIAPDIRNGLVIWLDGRNGWAVYSKPVNGGAEKIVTDNVSDKSLPKIGDKFITWVRETTDQGTDVWARDLATGATFPVAAGTGDQVSPTTDGSLVAYTEWSLSSSQMMVADVVVNPPQITKFTAPKSLRVGGDGKFTIAVSNTDATDTQTVSWDWGDGTTASSQLTGGGKPKMSHSYAQTGTFTVIVTVTDDIGIAVSKTAQVTVK